MKAAPYKIQQVLLDVNVCIDLIVNRSIPPHIKKKLFAIWHKNEVIPYLPAFSVDTLYYILNSRMKIDKQEVIHLIQILLKYTKLVHSTDEIIHSALSSGFSDFEDGLINALAEKKSMDAIITGNVKDFSKSSLPVYRPIDFVALFE